MISLYNPGIFQVLFVLFITMIAITVTFNLYKDCLSSYATKIDYLYVSID